MGMSRIWFCDLCEFKTFSYNNYRLHMERNHGIIVFRDEPKPVKTIYTGYGV